MRWALFALGLATLIASGCVVISPRHWAERRDEFVLEVPGVTGVEATTHNGDITARGDAGEQQTILVEAKVRGGGNDDLDAQECLDAIEIITPCSEDGATQTIGWRWRTKQRPGWQAVVSFHVVLPRGIAFHGQSQNGNVSAQEIDGDCTLSTHNGNVRGDDVGQQRLQADTHNGNVAVKSDAVSLSVSTHNGNVEGTLSGAALTEARVTSHNGNARVTLAAPLDATIQCETVNGRCRAEVPGLKFEKRSSRKVRGTIGTGAATLVVSTHNGNATVVVAGDESSGDGDGDENEEEHEDSD